MTQHIIINPKASLTTSTEDGVNVATIRVDGMGELRIYGFEDYPELSGNEAILDLLLDWAETQPMEQVPTGHLLTIDPIYDIWEALTNA